jgi:hypothetical protein
VSHTATAAAADGSRRLNRAALSAVGAAAAIAKHWVFVVNTPKTGTGTLQQSFLGSCGCLDHAKSPATAPKAAAAEARNHFELRGVFADVCAARDNTVLRAHHVNLSARFVVVVVVVVRARFSFL